MKRLFVVFVLCLSFMAFAQIAAANAPTTEDGIIAYVESRFDEAFDILEPKAQAGDPEAQFYVCKMYQFGQGVDKDEHAAKAWCDKAAKGGYAPGKVMAPK